MKVAEAMRFFCAYRGVAPREDLLERFDLESKNDSQIHELSGGQERRLALALAIAHDPRNPRPIAASCTSVFSSLPTMAVLTTETTICEDSPAIAGVAIWRISRTRFFRNLNIGEGHWSHGNNQPGDRSCRRAGPV